MTESTAQRWQKIYARARRRFDHLVSVQWDERAQCREDRRFLTIAGAQWEGDLGNQFENQLRFEVNKLKLAVRRIINEYRNNRIAADFKPRGETDSELSDTLDGLQRADLERSGGQECKDNAFYDAVGGGIGAWRLRSEYEDESDEDDDRQRICFELIPDADQRVWIDLDDLRADKKKANFGFILTSRDRDTYIDEWGDDPASWPTPNISVSGAFEWCTPDVIWEADYYEVEEQKRTVQVYQPITGDEVKVYLDEEGHEDQIADLTTRGYRKVREKQVKRRRVHKYVLGGNGVLSDEGLIAGENIPVVLVYGNRAIIDGIERPEGHIRGAKDPQRLKNMMVSRLGEIASLSAIEKPIFIKEQIAGLEQFWAEDNIQRYPYALVNALIGPDGTPMPATALSYTKPPSIPPALAALLQLTEQDIKDILGNPEGAEKLLSNIGQATQEQAQNRQDMQIYNYMDNMALAERRSGEIWLSMAQELYDEPGREMETVGEFHEAGTVVIAEPVHDDDRGAYKRNDIGNARMKVTVDVGPNFTTRRQSTVRSLSGMLGVTTDETDRQVLTATILMNTDGEGLGDVQAYYRRKLVGMGVIEPTEAEREEMQKAQASRPPDPQAELANALAGESKAKTAKAEADAQLSAAKVGQTEAETLKTLSEVRGGLNGAGALPSNTMQ